MGGAALILLDTHALIWLAAGSNKLGRKARRHCDQALPKGQLLVSAFSFWEAAMLALAGRLPRDSVTAEWRAERLASGLVEVPINGIIALRATQLAGLPGDPADRIIAASAIVTGARLLTADEAILDWSGQLPRLDARE